MWAPGNFPAFFKSSMFFLDHISLIFDREAFLFLLITMTLVRHSLLVRRSRMTKEVGSKVYSLKSYTMKKRIRTFIAKCNRFVFVDRIWIR